MAFIDCYIAKAASEDGSPPPAPSREAHFPNERAMFGRVLEWSRTGEMDVEQADWGCWVAKLTRAELLSLVDDEMRREEASWQKRPAGETPDVRAEAMSAWTRFRDYVEGLPEEEAYFVVAMESPGFSG